MFYADALIRERHITSTHRVVSNALTEIHNKLSFNLYNDIQAVKGIPALFAINPNLSQQDFSTAVGQFFDKQSQLRNIAAAPNLVIQYMYPVQGNEAAIGLDYKTIPEQIESVIKAKESRELTLAGPLQLVQGGTGLISRIPVYLYNSDGQEYFWGIISTVIDIDLLYQKSGLLDPESPIEIALRGKDGLGDKGEVFFGSAKLFEQKSILTTISLPNGSWQVAARPIGGWSPVPNDIWQQRAYLFFVAAILFGLLFSFLRTMMNVAIANLKFKTFLRDSPVPYALNSSKRKITFLNSAFTRLFGYSLEDLPSDEDWWLKAYPDSLYREKMKMSWNAYFDEFQSSNKPRLPLEATIQCKNGAKKTVLISLSPSNNNDYPIIFYDITDRKQAELEAKEKIEDLAFYDPLTRLPNRRLLVDHLTHAIAVCARNEQKGSVLFLDLDYFKTLNDTLGHDMGDVLLQQVAERLKACVRESDTVARFGGDEFVILLENLSDDPAHAVAETEEVSRKILISLSQPYQLGNQTYTGGVSIGSTLFDHNKSAVDELLKQADIAMYQAKESGRNSFRIFDPEMQAAITNRVALEKELQQAIELEQFELYYQIQIDAEHIPLGAEALIRWIHPERGLVSPVDFIALAEETGIIIPMGEWVLHSACQQLKAWQQKELTRELTLSVNVSAKQFRQKDFVSNVQLIVQQHNINPEKLKLELTESLLLDNIDETITRMNSLAVMGIQFSLDDFGTGYSSLQYLKRLPLHQLKIDQSFVRDLVTNNSDQAIVRTIIAMAHSLGLSVIAEGVETEQQKQRLLSRGCSNFQGYLFSKPLPINEFETLISEYEA
jgi:diguanylate cyclase (GGDEF)-like protein/PAS domain S-box-containing protein